jgi:hypothetical protein
MKDLTPPKGSLDAIEIASRDEIEALQLERMKWSLRHAYDNVPFYKRSFDAAGVHPDDLKSLSWQNFRSRSKPICATTTPSGCSQSPVSKSRAFMHLQAQQASRLSSVTLKMI